MNWSWNWSDSWRLLDGIDVLQRKLVVQSSIFQCKAEAGSVKPSRDELELELERLMEVA